MSEPLSEALERLHFHIDNQSGFWFALVAADSETPRARMRASCEAWSNEKGQTFYLHEPTPAGLVPLAIELAHGEKPGLHWIRADGVKGTAAEWEKHGTLLFMAMNERRDGYRKRLEGAIIVEGRAVLKLRLRDLAPDLFSIRAFIAEPTDDVEEEHVDKPASKRGDPSFDDVEVDLVDPDVLAQRVSRLEGAHDQGSVEKRIALRGHLILVFLRANRVIDAKSAADRLEKELPQAQGLPMVTKFAGDCIIRDALIAHAIDHGNWQTALMNAELNVVELELRPWNPIVADRSCRYAMRGRLRRMLNDFNAAAEDFRQAIKCDEQELARKATNADARGLLVEHSRNLNECLAHKRNVSKRDVEERITVLRHALDRVHAWDKENPGELRWLYTRCRLESELGIVLLRSGDFRGALDWHRRAVATAKECRRRDPVDSDIREAVVIGHVAHAVALLNTFDTSREARETYSQAFEELRSALRQATDSSPPLDLAMSAVVEFFQSAILRSQGDRPRALESLSFAAKRLGQFSRIVGRDAKRRATMTALELVARFLAAPDPATDAETTNDGDT